MLYLYIIYLIPVCPDHEIFDRRVSHIDEVSAAFMHNTKLRKVGGSIMLAVPRAILDLLHLDAGATVSLAVDGERLVVEPQPKPKYVLDELLAQCDPKRAITKEDRVWLNLEPEGREL